MLRVPEASMITTRPPKPSSPIVSYKLNLQNWVTLTRLHKNLPLIKSIKQQENKSTESDIAEIACYSNRISRNIHYRFMHVLQWVHPMASRAIVQLQEGQLITNFWKLSLWNHFIHGGSMRQKGGGSCVGKTLQAAHTRPQTHGTAVSAEEVEWLWGVAKWCQWHNTV